MKWKKCDVLIYIKKSRSANPQLSVRHPIRYKTKLLHVNRSRSVVFYRIGYFLKTNCVL